MVEYLKYRKYTALVALYFCFSIIIKICFSVDLTIPCLWRSIFEFKCIGCGTTTALIELLHFEFKNAFRSNPLIYLILPLAIFILVQDYRKFRSNKLS